MKIDLTETNSSKINAAMVQARRDIGTPAIGMVLTLVIVTDEENAYDALKSANDASHEHPSRIIVVIKRVSRSPRSRRDARLDAEVRIGADAGSGETVVLRLHGELVDHAQSVVLPLLLPDAPVVVWWPEGAPSDLANDPLGSLGQRRITDTYSCENPIGALAGRAAAYAPGDTDLSWTRITPWRSMLAAALDQQSLSVDTAVVEGEGDNPSCELLAMWLADRLGVPVKRTLSSGPGLTAVHLETKGGDIVLDRADGALATLSMPGQPDRAVALKRRETAELLAEELRRLDPDNTYEASLKFGVAKLQATRPAEPEAKPAPAEKPAPKPAKKPAAK
ncbi:glucose-6-phosphate dehydrogenase assembly protein OpcA [Streptomyces antarcticus]|uniref:glucose-6-phosphate dehydrogenase assembly protein OpcA n=1 Tax=Streptomyces antarcticus TaxID=2996458 RepID=UPI00226D9150|nr:MULTISPECIES: glucose-6-phosphate dehydrogenase assembly protein OpcA [unclassified Streptomyces]MCY0942006.1 glucose-6-phosphate dehydrogenase assembly protein OpcA [Streptomyces sp. H34-AA3]MCY0952200.1 glucose-6-phosphate dehydrogenase assembly protein OpcA [Streptomyces sp. H27-S2]MCZ4088380.1 glucose-6-phosphate dehydrogenase assembly protein OpcA [Streptomyces sp. H34-S5]